jgi:hypothetical protein
MAPRFCRSITGMAQAEKHALDVYANDRVEHVLVIFGGRRDFAFDSGIVEKAVDSAVGVECGFDIAAHLGRFGDVGGDKVRRTLLTDYPDCRGAKMAAVNKPLYAPLKQTCVKGVVYGSADRDHRGAGVRGG